MSVLGNGAAYRKAILGPQVKKSIDHANGAVTVFNITGGRALITSLVGRVTVAMGATTSNLKLVYNPTAAGTSFDLCTAVDVASDAVENTYNLSPVAVTGTPGALIVAGTVGQAQPVLQSPYLLQAGAIEANFSADATAGTIEWTVTYLPYDDGAAVVAA